MTYVPNSKRKNSNTTLNHQLYRLIRSIANNKEVYINSLIEEGMLYTIEKYKNYIPSELYEEELREFERQQRTSIKG